MQRRAEEESVLLIGVNATAALTALTLVAVRTYDLGKRSRRNSAFQLPPGRAIRPVRQTDQGHRKVQ